jgi:hypothetical protein
MNDIKTGDLVICTSSKWPNPVQGKMYRVLCHAFLPGSVYVYDPFASSIDGDVWMLEAHQYKKWENGKV